MNAVACDTTRGTSPAGCVSYEGRESRLGWVVPNPAGGARWHTHCPPGTPPLLAGSRGPEATSSTHLLGGLDELVPQLSALCWVAGTLGRARRACWQRVGTQTGLRAQPAQGLNPPAALQMLDLGHQLEPAPCGLQLRATATGGVSDLSFTCLDDRQLVDRGALSQLPPAATVLEADSAARLFGSCRVAWWHAHGLLLARSVLGPLPR